MVVSSDCNRKDSDCTLWKLFNVMNSEALEYFGEPVEFCP